MNQFIEFAHMTNFRINKILNSEILLLVVKNIKSVQDMRNKMCYVKYSIQCYSNYIQTQYNY